MYYVTAECQLRCLDTQGFRDGENDGPYREEVFQDDGAADIVWELDMCGRLGVFPHEATNSDVLPVGDLLMVSTSNGQNEGHTRVPSPRAPSLIAVDKRSGDVVWRAIGAGEQVLHGQWSSPVAANVNGRMQVLFGGGDGWLRSYDAASGHEIWRFDGNPKDARWLPRPGVLSRSSIIASPVFANGRVFVAMGQSPGHGNGPSLIHAISPNGQGDVTASRLLWTSREVGRVVGTPIEKDGLLYVGDLGGTIHCLDAATGAHVWKHETNGAIWGCLLLAGDRLYVGNEDGTMTVLRAGRRKQLLAADRDGCAALFASGAGRRCAVSGHREPVVPHRGKALTAHFSPRRTRSRGTIRIEMRLAPVGLLVLLASAPTAANWPQWRGPSGLGVSAESGLPATWSASENIAWSVALAGLGASSPIVWDDQVFVTSQIGLARRRAGSHPMLARDDAALVARERPIGGQPGNASGAAGPVELVVESFNRADGRRLWEYRLKAEGPFPDLHEEHNLATPTPVTDGRQLFAWFGTGQIAALDLKGALVWARHLGKEYSPFDIGWGHGSSPVLYGDLVILLCDHESASYLLALDARTGAQRWKADRGVGRVSFSTPLLVPTRRRRRADCQLERARRRL